ncbi:uncharacterized protein LOC117527460 isoform X2 [Thalassophryne amazonica]|uniref:uncharacterized protein LOC117527460 isoform X2 n=1 Tax=Thalassophryne amazonica TaxID=390379 RepID=UPI001471E61F|nr:uncharacterized protein LOC117527460 isoform X2 [Thalassophryne amazonica]
MSLLSVVEQTVRAYKTEQAKINECIRLYREVLQTVRQQPRKVSENPECSDSAATDASPQDKEEIELLEQALENALAVRTGIGTSKKVADGNKQFAPENEKDGRAVTSKDIPHATVSSKGNQENVRSASKSNSLIRKHTKHEKPVFSTSGSKAAAGYHHGKAAVNCNLIQKHPISSTEIVLRHAARKKRQAVSNSGSSGHSQFPVFHPKHKNVCNSVPSQDEKASTVSILLSNNTVSAADETGAQSFPQQNGIPFEQTAKWKSLRNKQSRLWEKVMAAQRKPAPGRSHFMERMRAEFPKDWPRGSPDQTRVLVSRLTHQGHDLTRYCQTETFLANQTSETCRELDDEENKSHERLQMTSAKVQKLAAQVKREWEAWDRWRPEGGCICSARTKDEWGDGMATAPLPVTITYSSEQQLLELENLRMRVALLQNEIALETLVDTLSSSQLSGVLSRPGSSNPSVLRDLYSLLGEGGQRFPAIVLDSEPD